MKVKNNYNECLTNLACYIAKYFGASYKHNTIDYIDKLLEEKNKKISKTESVLDTLDTSSSLLKIMGK